MNIREIQLKFIENASLLGDYSLLSKTELANGYCDADEAIADAEANYDNEEVIKQKMLKSAYHSALMLRYWYKIFEWMQSSSSLNLEPEEFVDWLVDSLYVAFYYRVWRWENEAIVKNGIFIEWKRDANGELIPNKYYYKVDPNAPDKIINRCCGSMRGRVYQFYNKHKRKAGVQTYSIDQMIDDNGDSALDYVGCISENSLPINDSIYSLVTSFIKKNEYIEALIVDGIANGDPFKDVKEKTSDGKTSVNAVFNPRLLVKHLNNIDEKSLKQFIKNYHINDSMQALILEKLKSSSNTKLYKCITKTLIEIKQTPSLLSCIKA